MLVHDIGSMVTHAKLPELGRGEILSWERGSTRIRFASGERTFPIAFVEPHLIGAQQGPIRLTAAQLEAAAARRKRV
jgi:hypothetical protein